MLLVWQLTRDNILFKKLLKLIYIKYTIVKFLRDNFELNELWVEKYIKMIEYVVKKMCNSKFTKQIIFKFLSYILISLGTKYFPEILNMILEISALIHVIDSHAEPY